MRKRLVALVMAMAMMMVVAEGFVAAAQAEGVEPYYTDTAYVSVGLSFSGGRATCSGSVRPNSPEKSAKVTIKLQKKAGSSWITTRTWGTSGSGLAGASIEGTKEVTAGTTYRVFLYGYVYDADGKVLEYVTKTSSSKVA